MQKKWVLTTTESVRPSTAGAERSLLPAPIAILQRRGIVDAAAIRSFLEPSLADMLDPAKLKGISAAAARLQTARRAGEQVCIYGDYDVDGITGTSLLVSFLRTAGFSCRYFIPNRFD